MNCPEKKLGCVVLTALLLLLGMVGCNQTEQANSTSEQNVVRETAWNSKPDYALTGTATEDGYYYYREEHFLSFFDTKTSKSVTLCNKVGCEHKDNSCYAFVDSAEPFTFTAGNEHLYTIETGADLAHHLIQRDMDGNNRKDVLVLLEDKYDGEHSVQISGYRVSGHTLYFVGSIVSGAQGETKTTASTSTAIYKVDLVHFKETKIIEAGENSYDIIAVNEEQIIYSEWLAEEQTATIEEMESGKYRSKKYLSSNQMQIKLWTGKTGEIKDLLEGNRWELLGGIAAYDDILYYIRWEEEHTKGSVYKLSLTNGENQKIYSPGNVIGSFVALDSETIMLKIGGEQGVWKFFSLKDFAEIPMDFLPEFSEVIQACKDGYIVTQVLEKTGSGDTFLYNKIAYSFISKEDAKAGKQNFTQFYVKEYQ